MTLSEAAPLPVISGPRFCRSHAFGLAAFALPRGLPGCPRCPAGPRSRAVGWRHGPWRRRYRSYNGVRVESLGRRFVVPRIAALPGLRRELATGVVGRLRGTGPRTRRNLPGVNGDDPEALDELDKVGQRKGGRPKTHNNVQGKAPTGNRESAALRRLRKDAPELHAEVLAGNISAHAARTQAER